MFTLTPSDVRVHKKYCGKNKFVVHFHTQYLSCIVIRVIGLILHFRAWPTDIKKGRTTMPHTTIDRNLKPTSVIWIEKKKKIESMPQYNTYTCKDEAKGKTFAIYAIIKGVFKLLYSQYKKNIWFFIELTIIFNLLFIFCNNRFTYVEHTLKGFN